MNHPYSNGSHKTKVVRINGSVRVNFEGCTHVTHVSYTMTSGCKSQTLKTTSTQLSLDCKSILVELAASTSATTPLTPVPRPSVAPDLESTEYSPISLPQAAPVEVHSSSESSDSSSDELISSVLELSNLDAFKQLCLKDEHTPARSAKFWSADPMASTHATFCPDWVEIVKRHAMVSASSGSPADVMDGKVLRYLHTSEETAESFLKQNALGRRYLFSGPMGASLHRMAHHHYSLSQATITEKGILIIGVFMSENYLTEHAVPAQNGYNCCESINLEDLDKAELKLHSCVHISGSVVQDVQSPLTTELTRASISHYEAIFQVNVLAELRVTSPEILLALGTSTPHSGKVHATLEHQQPEFYHQMMDVVNQIKNAGIKESAAASATSTASVGHSSNKTCINITLMDGDECTCAVTKKQKMTAAENSAV
eukprot:6487029-Amphidinium_carterae.1